MHERKARQLKDSGPPRILMSMLLLLLLCGAVLLVAYYLQSQGISPQSQVSVKSPALPRVLGNRSKVSDCHSLNGLPDSACTPGALDPNVTQENISSTICVSGYTKTVRPPASYTNGIKKEEMLAYGESGDPRAYELDHLISLELGGSPRDIANLWPEPGDPVPGFHQKDKVENYLHDQVCTGSLSLAEAQQEIAGNWVAVFQRLQPGR